MAAAQGNWREFNRCLAAGQVRVLREGGWEVFARAGGRGAGRALSAHTPWPPAHPPTHPRRSPSYTACSSTRRCTPPVRPLARLEMLSPALQTLTSRHTNPPTCSGVRYRGYGRQAVRHGSVDQRPGRAHGADAAALRSSQVRLVAPPVLCPTPHPSITTPIQPSR